MRGIKRNSQGARLIRALVRAYPEWLGGREGFGDDFYTARNRFGDTLRPRGYPVVGRKRERERSGKKSQIHEWRFASEVVYHEAALLVRSWETGEDLEMLKANDGRLQRARAEAAAIVRNNQGSLGL